MAIKGEDDIQEDLCLKASAGEFQDHEARYSLPQTPGLRRFERAWTWPLDCRESRTLPAFPDPKGPPTSNTVEGPSSSGPIKDPPPGHTLWEIIRWLGKGLVICFAAYVLVNTWRYAHTPGPTILQGWSQECPADWLYQGQSDMILLGYQRRFDDIRPPWRVLRTADKTYQRCWRGDRNRLHQDNRLGISFPQAGSETFGNTNAQILHRSKQALADFDSDGFPYTAPETWPTDGLPSVGSACPDQCGLEHALKAFLLAVLDPRADVTAGYPQTVDELPFYCPCSFELAWRNARLTYAHLPRPFSIHPFYTNRSSSSLYRTQDLFSWWVWLRGNDFFVPWRRTSIAQLSDDELRALYADGFWNNTMGGARRFSGKTVREARGVKLSRAERERIEQQCAGFGSWCVELHML